MKGAARTRLNVFVELEHAHRLRELAKLKRVSISSLMAQALALLLSPEGQDRREAALVRRLDRLARQFERLERDQSILIEAIALFIRYELSVSTSVPEAQQEGVRVQGKARFEKFVSQLARHLQRGGSLVRDLHAEIYPDGAALDGNDDSNGSGSAQ